MKLDAARRAAREQGDFMPLVACVPYAGYLDFRIALVDGIPQLHLPFRRSLIGNPKLPALHGGVVAAFMENSALLHLMLTIDEDRVPKSIDFSIDYLRSARALDCYASCLVARLGRRVAQVQIRAWQQDEAKPVALARAHFLLAASAESATIDAGY